MEFKSKAMAAVADMAATHASANAVHARIAADAAEAYARRLDIDAKAKAYGFSHDDVLRALDAAAAPKVAMVDMLAKEHPGEAIVPKAFNPRDGGQASGERLESRVSQAMEEIRGWSAAAFRSAALQPEGDEAGRRFIEHGAMCYANCFLRIQRALGAALPPP